MSRRQSRKLAAQRLKETVDHLWTCYAKDRANVEIRNRLVEHYTPVIQELAQHWMEHYRLRDVDTAMGDALLALLVEIVPKFDGQRDFRAWANLCVRRKMAQRKRLEARHRANFADDFGAEDFWQLTNEHVRRTEPGADLRFAELVARVTAREGALLWLQFYRHLPDKQIAAALNATVREVRSERLRAIRVLRMLATGDGTKVKELKGKKLKMTETPTT
jgi:RNA polymerase sigma factor (sigma-70 family)